MNSKLKEHQNRKRILKKRYILFTVIAAIMVISMLYALNIYNKIFGGNVNSTEKQVEIFIPSNPTFEEVTSLLEYSAAIEDINSLVWLADFKNVKNSFKGGRYILKNGMNNNTILNMLVGGIQSPVKVTFNNIRTVEDLSGALSKRFEADSIEFISFFKNDSLIKKLGYNKETILAYILPNTYEMWWTTKPEEFIKRMQIEYDRFWNAERKKRAKEIGLSSYEVSILASIVDEETSKADERKTVAGLYMNRLNRGMRLEADPTIKYVLNDFTVRRILNRDLIIDSPYNTYKYAGLPPGPIRMPSTQAIDAVLYYENHNYLFMCAKEDFSGYHNFAKTLRQHNVNAAKYRRALHNLKIYR